MKSPIEESPECLALLGTITARWATLDSILVYLWADLVGSLAVAEALYFSIASQKARMDQLKSGINAAVASAEWTKADRDAVVPILDRISDLWKTRNNLLHSYSVATPDNPKRRYWAKVIRPANKQKERMVELTPESLSKHAEDVGKAGTLIFEYVWADVLKEHSFSEREHKTPPASP